MGFFKSKPKSPQGTRHFSKGPDDLKNWTLRELQRERRRIDAAKSFNSGPVTKRLREAERAIMHKYGYLQGGQKSRREGTPAGMGIENMLGGQFYGFDLARGRQSSNSRIEELRIKENQRESKHPRSGLPSAGSFSDMQDRLSAGSFTGSDMQDRLSARSFTGIGMQDRLSAGSFTGIGMQEPEPPEVDPLFEEYDAARGEYIADYDALGTAGGNRKSRAAPNAPTDDYFISRLSIAIGNKRASLTAFRSQTNIPNRVDPSAIELKTQQSRRARANRSTAQGGGSTNPNSKGPLDTSGIGLEEGVV